MNSPTTCPECGAALKPGASLCPACLLSAGAATLPLQPVSAGITALPCDFGGYRLLKKLGAGGMGIVYEAEQISSGRRIALKVLNQCLDNEEQRQRFLREGRLAATIDHPNSVYVFGTEEIEGVPVIAMELAAGGTLRDELKRRGTLPVSDAVDAILGIIDGLEAAHARGVLHRDMKPSNCFVSAAGTAIVGDYGLSISQTNNLPDGEQLTRSGLVMGTPAFSPPEQLRAQPLDLRADIYSTGGTLYYLLTGKAPVERHTPVETVAAVLEGRIPSVRTLRPEVPEDLAAVIARCLSADAEKRPASYAELRLALLPFSSVAPEPAPLGRRLIAGFIDSQLTLLAVFLLMALVEALSPLWNETSAAGGEPLWIPVVSFLLPFVYHVWFESRRGATPGKWTLGMAVADLRGGLPNWRQAAVRALLYLGPPIIGVHLTDRHFPTEEVEGWRSQVFVASLLVLVVSNLSLLLFLPALRRRDRAAWHDSLTRTRVVLTRQTAGRRRVENTLPAGTADVLEVFGPFEGIADLPPDARLARDPALRRLLLLTRRDHAPAEARRSAGRAGRLRWLQSVQDSSGTPWDAWQMPGGAPLTQIIQNATPNWPQMLPWLRDLSEELAAAAKDGTTPATLSLAQVWITTDGRAMLLDHAWPGLQAEDSVSVAETTPENTAQAFLHRLASLCPAQERPLHADALLHGLAASSFERLSHVAGNVVHLLQQRTTVSLRSRAMALFAPVLIVMGMMFSVMMMTQSVVERAWTKPYPGLPILPEVLKMYAHADAPTTTDMPPGLKAQIRRHLAGHYSDLLAAKTVRLPEHAPLPERHRVILREILGNTPMPSAADLATADAAVHAAVPRFQQLHPEHSGKINLRKALSPVTFGLLCALCLWQFVCILTVGSPLQMRLSDIAAVTRTDRPASRLRMLVRWSIGWSLLLGVMAVQIARLVNGVDVIRTLPQFAQVFVPVFLVVALIGLLWPRRTLVDRLAGTWLVAR